MFGYFFMTKAALPHLKEGSAIVNTASVTAYHGQRAARLRLDQRRDRGVHPLALAAARRARIRVNAVAPGPIWTPLIPASFEAERVAKFGAIRRWAGRASPTRWPPVPRLRGFLYMTGQVLHPNGGEMVGG